MSLVYWWQMNPEELLKHPKKNSLRACWERLAFGRISFAPKSRRTSENVVRSLKKPFERSTATATSAATGTTTTTTATTTSSSRWKSIPSQGRGLTKISISRRILVSSRFIREKVFSHLDNSTALVTSLSLILGIVKMFGTLYPHSLNSGCWFHLQ